MHAGRHRDNSVDAARLTVKNLANHYLAHQLERSKSGELKPIHFRDCQGILRAFSGAVGKATPLDELTPQNLHAYRAKLVKDHAPSIVNRHIAVIKAMLNYGLDFGLIERVPNLRKALAKVSMKLLRRFADEKRRVNGCSASFDRTSSTA